MKRLAPYWALSLAAILAAWALPCFGGDVAVLKNGFSIRHERREVVGDVTRLYVSRDGSSFVDVPTAEIEHFEAAAEEPASGARVALSAPRVAARSSLPASAPGRPASGKTAGFNSKIAFPSRPTSDLTTLVNEASGRYRLDPDLVNSVIKAESAFNARAVSPRGAQGLMQLMPGTASQLGVPNAFDPEANVEGGTKYLRELLERYNFDLVKALAAYNAGPRRVERFGGVPPYYETRAYVARIVRDFNKKKLQQEKALAAAKKKAAPALSAKSKVAPPKHKTNAVVAATATAASE